jgi:hypothetical protein
MNNRYFHCIYLEDRYYVSRVVEASSIQEAYDKVSDWDEELAAEPIKENDLLIEVLEDTSIGLISDTYILLDGVMASTIERFKLYEHTLTSSLMEVILNGEEDCREFKQAAIYMANIHKLVYPEPIEEGLDTLPIASEDEVLIERIEELNHIHEWPNT